MTVYGFIIGAEIAGILLLLFWIFKPYPFFDYEKEVGEKN